MSWRTDTGVCAKTHASLRQWLGRAAAEVGWQRIVTPAGRAAAKCQAPAARHKRLSGSAKFHNLWAGLGQKGFCPARLSCTHRFDTVLLNDDTVQVMCSVVVQLHHASRYFVPGCFSLCEDLLDLLHALS